MKISTRGRYALRLMLDLAIHQNDHQFVTIKSIAERQQLSEKYLEQIVTKLGRAGLVVSARGPQGGYKMSRDPGDYTVGEILRIMEGGLAPVSESHSNLPYCSTEEVWKRLAEAIDGVVDGVTLADLAKWQEDAKD
jgi:Rrf2 family protein